jgi:hypothetical protein
MLLCSVWGAHLRLLRCSLGDETATAARLCWCDSVVLLALWFCVVDSVSFRVRCGVLSFGCSGAVMRQAGLV